MQTECRTSSLLECYGEVRLIFCKDKFFQNNKSTSTTFFQSNALCSGRSCADQKIMFDRCYPVVGTFFVGRHKTGPCKDKSQCPALSSAFIISKYSSLCGNSSTTLTRLAANALRYDATLSFDTVSKSLRPMLNPTSSSRRFIIVARPRPR